MDIKSAEDRSRNMSHIRSRDTSAEVYIRHLLYRKGYRYRIAPKEIPGKPDLWFSGKKTAIFIHGCFWHRHAGCKLAYMPKSRVEFWQKKFDANMARDQEVHRQLIERNIRCLIVWECTIRKMRRDPETERSILGDIARFLEESKDFMEL